jgi:outer membrane lipoprotein carrier protein
MRLGEIKGGAGGFLIFIILLSYLSEMFFTAERSHADTISKIIDLQKSIKTIKTDFIQEKHSALMNRPIISSGTFFFLSPDKFVWDYKKGMKVTSDGKSVMVYYEELKEAEIVSLDNLPSLPGGFSVEKLREHYYIELLEQSSNKYILKVTPVIKSNIFREIMITLDEKAIPVEVKMVERTGDDTVIRFIKRETNIAIPEEVFSVKVPEGVKIRKYLKDDRF